MAVNLVNKDQVELTLRFRVFDDGVGFRYEYNVPAADSLLITDELTTFRFRQDGTSWSIPASAETYELLYAQRPISEVEQVQLSTYSFLPASKSFPRNRTMPLHEYFRSRHRQF